MIFSLLLLVGVAVAVPVPEVEDALLGTDINVIDPETILQFIKALGKRQVEDGWLEDLIAVAELYGPIDSGIGRKRLEPVKARRILPPLLAALDPNILLEYLGKRQTEDNILEDIVVGLISTGLFPLGGGKREIEDGLWDNIVNALVSVYETATDPEVVLLSAYHPLGKRQIEDNLWDDIVNGVVSAYEYLTSPEVTAALNQALLPVGKRQVEDGLWEDIVNTLVKASKAIDEAYIASIPVGKRQVEDGLWEDIVSFLVKTSEEINEAYTPIGKRQVKRLIATVIALYPGGLPNPLGKRQA